jgi:hypothetical protein
VGIPYLLRWVGVEVVPKQLATLWNKLGRSFPKAKRSIRYKSTKVQKYKSTKVPSYQGPLLVGCCTLQILDLDL